MGSIRFLLAFAVVCAHSGVAFSVGGKLAVQLFYMISGFLMSYILVEKRSYGAKWAFYKSRFLRIYPVYVVVLFLSLGGYALFMPHWYDKFATMPNSARALLGVTQVTLLGLDIPMFTGVRGGGLHFVTKFMDSTPPLFTGLAVAQAWTLSLELYFYLLAPFILHRRNLVIALLVGSLLLRAVLISKGIGDNDPWSYRFFPTELALFLGGALSHQFLLPWASAGLSRLSVHWATASVIAVLALYATISGSEQIKEFAMFVMMIGALPILFKFQNAHRWDASVGNLSYPIYVNHLFVLHVMRIALPKLGIVNKIMSIGLSFAAVVVFAYFLNKFIAEPVDIWRGRFRSIAS